MRVVPSPFYNGRFSHTFSSRTMLNTRLIVKCIYWGDQTFLCNTPNSDIIWLIVSRCTGVKLLGVTSVAPDWKALIVGRNCQSLSFRFEITANQSLRCKCLIFIGIRIWYFTYVHKCFLQFLYVIMTDLLHFLFHLLAFYSASGPFTCIFLNISYGVFCHRVQFIVLSYFRTSVHIESFVFWK